MLGILEKYDVLLVDAYGVFWDGDDFIPGTLDAMKHLVDKGKIVIVLSNSTQLTKKAIKKYKKRGLCQGEHFHYLVTSGEITRKFLEEESIFSKKYTRFYTLGTPNNDLFLHLPYESVPLKEAEFAYIGVPQLTNEEKSSLDPRLPVFQSTFTSSKDPLWDTTGIRAFAKHLNALSKVSIPILNANPDKFAPERCKLTGTKNYVLRQGSIASALQNRGLKVYEFGKPHSSTFGFCQELINKELNLKNPRVAMVGDTVETDILGAHNAKKDLDWPIDSILTLTGNAIRTLTAEEKVNPSAVSAHLEKQFAQHKCQPSHTITSFGIEGHSIS